MEQSLDTAVTTIVRLTMVVVMFSMGLQVTGGQILTAVRRFWLMARALLANLILFPIVAVILARLFQLPQEITLGFLLVAIVPGAPLIPKFVEIARGHLPFSVGLTVVLAVLTLFTVPMTASMILPVGGDIIFNPLQVISVLIVFQLFPLLLGLSCRLRWDQVAIRFIRPSMILSNLLVFIIIVLVLIRDHQALMAMPWSAFLAMVLLTIIMLTIGWLLGGPEADIRRALALGTCAQFSTLALLITNLNFPETAADITVIAFGLLILVIGTAAALYWQRNPTSQAIETVA